MGQDMPRSTHRNIVDTTCRLRTLCAFATRPHGIVRSRTIPSNPGRMLPVMRAIFLPMLLGVSACGSGDRPATVDAGIAPDADHVPDFDEPQALIVVGLVDNPATGESLALGLDGHLRREPMPDPMMLVTTMGACRYRTSQLGFCDPFCENGVCVSDGVCVPFPADHDAGALTLELPGGARTVPFEPYGYQFYEVGDPVQGGQPLAVHAPGADFAAFELEAVVPAPLLIEGPWPPDFVRGQDLVLRWAPDPGARIYLRLVSDTAGHGLYPPAAIECEAPDTGELLVPWPLLERLLEPANWGCGDCRSSMFTRRRQVDRGGTDPVTLRVERRADLYIAGWVHE
jgi:hypothetical protein